jgi:DNA-binding transcriptional ArsR family regulator
MRTIPKEWRALAKVFVALGDEHRQRILLTFEKGERLTVGQIAEVATLSRPAVSHHLKILRQAGVLEAQREGAKCTCGSIAKCSRKRWRPSSSTSGPRADR